MTILIVDDNEQNLYQLQVLLGGNGFQIITAANGAEALEKARQTPPGLIITDILMPVMDGFSLCREWMKDERLRKIPLVFYSATYTDERDQEFALSLGAERFMVKPEEPVAFIHTIREVIQQVASAPPATPPPPADTPPRLSIEAPKEEQAVYLKHYNEVLIRKLEAKLGQLERANRELEQNLADRQRAEERIRHLKEVLLAVREVNKLIVRERDSDRLLADACGILMRTRGYRLVWVGMVEPDSKRVVPVARSGERSDYLDAVAMTWDESDTGRGPIGTAFRTRQITVCQDTAKDPRFVPWREAALARGYRSAASVPLIYGTRLFGGVTVYADRPEAFDEEELGLLGELASDLAFALQNIENERQRRQAEAALFESQANLDRAESFSHMMVCHVALDGQWLKVPLPLGQLLGYSTEELMSGRLQEYFHPDDAAENWRQMQRLMVSDCRTFGEEKRFVNRQGAVVWLDFHCILVSDAAQKPVLFLIYLRDITQAKIWEEKTIQQGRLLDLAPSAIILRNLDDVIFYWNQGAERLYGWNAEEAIGRKTTDLFCQDLAQARIARQRIAEVREWTGEIRRLTKSGQDLTVDSRWMLLQELGHAPTILTIDTDVTEHKKLEAQFMRAQRLESIGRLASGIAHDLNNILAPMLMAPAILREELRSEASKIMIDTIEKNAIRGAEIVKQLLTFGRGVESQRGPLQLRSLIRDITAIMRATFPKNITPRVRTSPDPWLVTADATQLHQVLMNLCVNARDAMPQGGELTLALENTLLDESIASMMPGSQAGPYVLLTVTDTGTGIPPECLDQIFDPFYTTKEPGKGTGLGLSTVLRIVHSHRGFILVKSKVDQGTQFMVYLPANMTTPNLADEKLEKLPQGSGELILVVDDEDNIRIMLRRLLERNGYRALLSSDGAEALTLYAQNQKHVRAVVTDSLMPFMDGPSLIKALRRLDPQVKILTISGLLMLSEQGGPPLESQPFLAKPFTAGAFLRALDELLHCMANVDAEPS